jgi:ABC-type maltose transport system permease subunit
MFCTKWNVSVTPIIDGASPGIKMRTTLQIIAFAVSLVLSFQSQAQTGDAIFPKGELSTVKNHTGNIWLKELNVGDSTFDSSVAVATYDAGARLDWHIHPVVKFYSLQKALAIIRRGESQYRWSTRGM